MFTKVTFQVFIQYLFIIVLNYELSNFDEKKLLHFFIFFNFSMDVNFAAENWVNAPEFVPLANTSNSASFSEENCASGTTASLSYAQAVNPMAGPQHQASFSALDPLCPYAEANVICKKINCPYLHGDICDMCSRPALHPFNEEMRKKHINVSLGFAYLHNTFNTFIDKKSSINEQIILFHY